MVHCVYITVDTTTTTISSCVLLTIIMLNSSCQYYILLIKYLTKKILKSVYVFCQFYRNNLLHFCAKLNLSLLFLLLILQRLSNISSSQCVTMVQQTIYVPSFMNKENCGTFLLVLCFVLLRWLKYPSASYRLFGTLPNACSITLTLCQSPASLLIYFFSACLHGCTHD